MFDDSWRNRIQLALLARHTHSRAACFTASRREVSYSAPAPPVRATPAVWEAGKRRGAAWCDVRAPRKAQAAVSSPHVRAPCVWHQRGARSTGGRTHARWWVGAQAVPAQHISVVENRGWWQW